MTLIKEPFYKLSDLTERQNKILSILKEHKSVSRRNILKVLEETVSDRTLKRELSQLKELGLINSEGLGPKVVWLIEDKHKS